MIKVSRGLNLPIAGSPQQQISEAPKTKRIAVVGDDYIDLKPTMAVNVGDKVKKGQLLFNDKKTEGVCYTAPASGEVVEINRGAKRVFESLVIEVQGDEQITFNKYDVPAIAGLSFEQVRDQLVESGVWTAFRTRPFSKVPATNTKPVDIFVNAMDSNPLAVEPCPVIDANQKSFEAGMLVVSKLTEGKVYLCTHADKVISALPSTAKNISMKQFKGKHPAGLTGTHIHFVSPVSLKKTVWSVNYQDVIAIGNLFLTGEIDNVRVVALAGPSVKEPRLLRTEIGSELKPLLSNELVSAENRIISGSVFGGRHAQSTKQYLGRYHLQICVLEEGYKRDFLGWLSPGFSRFSTLGIYISQLFRGKKYAFSTNTNGSPRAIVPVGAYERVMPLDILATQLLRAIIVGDIEVAIDLGVLELDEEDLALCTFVCPGKYEYGPILRDMLRRIEKEVL